MQKKVKRMNTGLFLLGFLCPIVAVPVFLIEGADPDAKQDIILIIVASCVAVWLLCSMLLHYRMWTAIYDEHVNMHPILAVVLFLIPILNIFWAFGFYRGFVGYYDDTIRLYGLESRLKPIKGGAFHVLPVLYVIDIFAGWISVVGVLLGFITYVVFLAVVLQAGYAVNSLANAMEEKSTSADVLQTIPRDNRNA